MSSSGQVGHPHRRHPRRPCGHRRHRRCRSPWVSARSACRRSAPADWGSARLRRSHDAVPVLRGSPACRRSASAGWGWPQSSDARCRPDRGRPADARRAHAAPAAGGQGAAHARRAAAGGRFGGWRCCRRCCCCHAAGRRAAHHAAHHAAHRAGRPGAAASACVPPPAAHAHCRPGVAPRARRPRSGRRTRRASGRAAAPRSRSGCESGGSRPGPPCRRACAPRGCGLR